MMTFDPIYWLFAIPGLLLGLYAQFKLTSTYHRYMQVGVQSGVTGAEAAREILDRAGLRDVPVGEVPGKLSDHYDPTKRALFLSTANYRERSISAVGVAAHEAGHALQHKAAYAPLKLRMTVVPVTQFASTAWQLILMAGLFCYYANNFALGGRLIWIAIALFSLVTLFQVITLPVEFDASRRAKEQLLRLGIVQPGESSAISRVLSAAALTYVAAMVGAVLNLLYLLSLTRERR